MRWCGCAINPLILHGQTHGRIAQVVGQALRENSYYEPETGQLLAASFMDYAMPRADTLPFLATTLSQVPAPSNSARRLFRRRGRHDIGVCCGDHRHHRRTRRIGVHHIQMPATPERGVARPSGWTPTSRSG